ncbi:hypothetical protein [Qingshengfaniella alkalisoli]|uniref:2TM domain-containing protein n=1 Tax=Qingshengfaniella alkalisoli TaxID=2599296 RepID=A0A5B8ITC5_9RHOB|nr:hypothetical protein [Qingshengfaniella alkalisoli]QDY68894.1 hypothetical protein FPZ52_04100 [Qingshengfaniella alkalisoli]
MARYRRDPLHAYNERVKLLAGFTNAIGLGLIGFAILRPMTADPAQLGPLSWYWGGSGLAFHIIAHYILGRLRKGVTDDPV